MKGVKYPVSHLSPIDVAVRFGGGTFSAGNPFLPHGLFPTEKKDHYCVMWGRKSYDPETLSPVTKKGTLAGENVVHGHWLPYDEERAIRVPAHELNALAGAAASMAAITEPGFTGVDFVLDRSWMPKPIDSMGSRESSLHANYRSDMGTSYLDGAVEVLYGMHVKQRIDEFLNTSVYKLLTLDDRARYLQFSETFHKPVMLLAFWSFCYGHRVNCQQILEDVQQRLTFYSEVEAEAEAVAQVAQAA